MLKNELIKQLIKASIHYGHSIKEWNPKMAPYLLTIKSGYHIFDLIKTIKFLKLAGDIAYKTAKKKQKILFIGTNRLSSLLVEKYAKSCQSSYINYRWLGGMFTNWETIQTRIQRLKELEKMFQNKGFETSSKKEYNKCKKELEKLQKLLDLEKNVERYLIVIEKFADRDVIVKADDLMNWTKSEIQEMKRKLRTKKLERILNEI